MLVAAANGVDRVIGVVCRAVVLVTVIVLLGVLGANLVARYLLAQGGFIWISEIPNSCSPG